MVTVEKIKNFFFDDKKPEVSINKKCLNCKFYNKDIRDYGKCSSTKFNNFVKIEYNFIDIEPDKLQEIENIKLIRVHPEFHCPFWKLK